MDDGTIHFSVGDTEFRCMRDGKHLQYLEKVFMKKNTWTSVPFRMNGASEEIRHAYTVALRKEKLEKYNGN